MNGWAIAALALMALEALIMVSRVGKPRPPLTPGNAAAGLAEWVALSVLVVLAASA